MFDLMNDCLHRYFYITPRVIPFVWKIKLIVTLHNNYCISEYLVIHLVQFLIFL